MQKFIELLFLMVPKKKIGNCALCLFDVLAFTGISLTCIHVNSLFYWILLVSLCTFAFFDMLLFLCVSNGCSCDFCLLFYILDVLKLTLGVCEALEFVNPILRLSKYKHNG